MSYSLESILAPIREGAPAGDDVRYSPDFGALQAEIDKRNSITGAKQINWATVADLACSLLTSQGKDLLVAAYFANALCYLQGLQGFTLGVQLLNACCREYWSVMFPAESRIQGRVNAFDWWMENSGNFLRSGQTSGLSQEDLEAVVATLAALDGFLQEKNPGFPSLNPLIRLLKKLESGTGKEGDSERAAPLQEEEKKSRQAPDREEPQRQTSARARKAARSPSHAAAADATTRVHDADGTSKENTDNVAGIASDEECAGVEGQLRALAGAVCSWRLPRGPQEPYYYCLNRMTAWSTITLPQHVSGKTALEPADSSFRELLHDLHEQADWPALLGRSERMLCAHPYWLDLCRFTDESLTALGEDHAQARAACASLTALFLERLRGIQDLSYADGTPFADAATKEWLSGLSASRGGKQTLSFEGRRKRVREQALAEVRAGDILKASHRIEACMQEAPSPAERMQWRILLAQMLNEADQNTLARMHFDILLEQVERHSLEEWDKELAVAVLSAAYKGMHALESESIAEIRTGLLKRISRISPSLAVQLGKA